MITDAGCGANSIQPHFVLIQQPFELPFWVRYGGRTWRWLHVLNEGYVTFRDLSQDVGDPNNDDLDWQGSYQP